MVAGRLRVGAAACLIVAGTNGFAHADPVKKPRSAPSSHPSAPGRDEPLAEIGEIIVRLSALRDRERDSVLRGSYRSGAERGAFAVRGQQADGWCPDGG
jgi:hypothetical protein